jgi:hypothetical protein
VLLALFFTPIGCVSMPLTTPSTVCRSALSNNSCCSLSTKSELEKQVFQGLGLLHVGKILRSGVNYYVGIDTVTHTANRKWLNSLLNLWHCVTDTTVRSKLRHPNVRIASFEGKGPFLKILLEKDWRTTLYINIFFSACGQRDILTNLASVGLYIFVLLSLHEIRL